MILLVAPRSDLEYVDEEIKRVVNFLRPRVLIGVVTLAQVVDELQNYPIDILWFAAHSTEEGIQLSDGALSPTMLAQLLQASPPRLVFVNTCNSLQIIMEIHDAVKCMVIGTVRDVPDREAFVTGSALARAIGSGMDLTEAYNVSRPSQNRTYIMLNGTIKLNGEKEIDDTNQLLMFIIKRQDELDKSVKHQLHDLREGMEHEYQPRITPIRVVYLLVGYVLYIVAAMFITHELPKMMDLTPAASLTIMSLLQVIAGALFLLGAGISIEQLSRKRRQG